AHAAVYAILASAAYESGRSPQEVRQAYLEMSATSSIWDNSLTVAELTRAQVVSGKSVREVYEYYSDMFRKQTLWGTSYPAAILSAAGLAKSESVNDPFARYPDVKQKAPWLQSAGALAELTRASLFSKTAPAVVHAFHKALRSKHYLWPAWDTMAGKITI